MLTLPEFIAQRLIEDSLNERDRSQRLENLKICINYVLDYFTSYIDISPEEELTTKKKELVEKYRQRIQKYTPEIIDWLIQDYIDYGRHVDILIRHVVDTPSFLLCTDDSEFRRLSYKVYGTLNKRCPFLYEQSEMIFRFLKDYHRLCTGLPGGKSDDGVRGPFPFTASKDIDFWIDTTFHECHVNLEAFAFKYLGDYLQDYKIWPSDHRIPTGVKLFPYEYNYKNLKNVFNIDGLYRNIFKKKFMRGRKQELEILLMHQYTQKYTRDDEFWEFYCKQVGIIR